MNKTVNIAPTRPALDPVEALEQADHDAWVGLLRDLACIAGGMLLGAGLVVLGFASQVAA